jgi:hypothetical protein
MGIKDNFPMTDGVEARLALRSAGLDEEIDTDNALIDGKFKPSVAGYYQINGTVNGAGSSPTPSMTTATLYKNGTKLMQGSQVKTNSTDDYTNYSICAVVTTVVYLNGTTDYIELYASANSTSPEITSDLRRTHLSAILVSGGSASGDSIWTEEDGKAIYDGDIQVNGVTVGKGSGTNTTSLGVGANDNTTGDENVGVGFFARKDSTSGNGNVAVGYSSLLKATGNKNTAIGYNSGELLTTGSNNILIGNGVQASSPVISNEVTIGNTSVTNNRFSGAISIADKFKMTSGSSGNGNFIGGTANSVMLSMASDGRVSMPEYDNLETSPSSANVYMASSGRLYKSAATSYTAEEVDKKLAIKDKLIEKLSERLDKLEKKLKKAK